MKRCPNCRARYRAQESETPDADILCRRCGMNLSPLLALEQQTAHLHQRIVQALLYGDMLGARNLIKQAQQLRYEPLLAELLTFTDQGSDQQMQAMMKSWLSR